MGFNQSSPRRSGSPPRRGSGPSPAGQTATGVQYPLPAELTELYSSASKDNLNPAVIFDRFAPDLSKAGDKKEEWKRQALQSAAGKADSSALRAYLNRWQTLVQACGAQPFTLQTDWRFIPGLGRKSALEIGFSFHRYGFPYLTGSAVKGIARTWAVFELAEKVGLSTEQPEAIANLDKLLEKPDEDFFEEATHASPWRGLTNLLQEAELFRAVFGTLEQAGGALFFEAIPAEAFALEIDIMNPHYGPYYQGKDAPADWHNPVPVAFLTVPAGKTFHFAVAWRRAAQNPEWRAKAEEWLKNGLKELGAGAKTAAGYGYFK